MNNDVEPLEFADRDAFRVWLKTNHEQSAGVWIVFVKGNASFSANDALEEALCFGWIDGVMKKIDERAYRKYFSRRKNAENWSDKNIALYHSLVDAGLMTKAGEEAYCHKGNINKKKLDVEECIDILKSALANDGEISELFGKASPSKRKRFSGFYCDAKTDETKRKRLAKIVDALRTNYDGMLY